jgi:hypothetical protein
MSLECAVSSHACSCLAQYRLAQHVRWIDYGSTAVILCLTSGTFLALNESARAIWNSLVSTGSAITAAEHLHLNFAIDIAAARREVDHFIESCRQQELIDDANLSSNAEYLIRTESSTSSRLRPSMLSAVASIPMHSYAASIWRILESLLECFEDFSTLPIAR